MKKALLFSVILLSCLILSSCSVAVEVPVQQKTSPWDKAWVGKSYSQIANKFGSPEIVVKDGNDGQVMIYDGISVDGPSGDDSARFFIGADGLCRRVVPGAALSSADGGALQQGTYDEEYGYEEASGSRSVWPFILDNAFNLLLAVSIVLLLG